MKIILRTIILISLLLMIFGFEQKPVCEKCHDSTFQNAEGSLKDCKSCHKNFTHMKELSLEGFNDKDCTFCHNHYSFDRFYLKSGFIRSLKGKHLNPHNSSYMCVSCHKTTETGKMSKKLLFPNDVKVCERCHNEKYVTMEAHSVNFEYRESEHVKIPDNFPLYKGKVTCLTCHKFKCEKDTGHVAANDYYLRVKTNSRQQFCLRCHVSRDFKRYNPHIQFDEKGNIIHETCVVCHSKEPNLRTDDSRKDVELKGTVNEICNGCHMIRTDHPTSVNHIKKMSNKMLTYLKDNIKEKNIYFPIGEGGKVLCVTCHLPHQFRLIEVQAKGKYPKRTRLLSGYDLCLMCHEK